ncbi:MAG: acyl-ACP--UDP-N-acetylglucosamine O-acyltransferase [Deltaproteobacteria bacterium]|nr:acyl-ACP--UDP-N-acetylglucosamine O-acyltransferase [Deltaproteobacteria bacterium]
MIHKTAMVHPHASIHSEVNIGPYCVIGEGVHIDSGCELKSHVVVQGPTHLGKNNKIYSFVSLGEAPQDLKFKGENSELIIGENNTIREYVSIHRGTQKGEGKTVIGNNNLLMTSVHIGHNCILGDDIIIATGSGVAGHAVVEDRVVFAGMVGVAPFIHVGRNSYITGFSVIDKDVPPFSICSGRGEFKIRGVNVIGLKRNNFSIEDIQILRKSFKHLFTHINPLSIQIDNIERDWKQNVHVQYLLNFLLNSKNSKNR